MKTEKEEKSNLSLRSYLYHIRFYILFVFILFILSIVLGYNGFLSDVFSQLVEWLEQISGSISDFTQLYPLWIVFLAFFTVIFANNAFTCLRDIILGPLIGVFPLVSVFINGGLIGWFAQEEGLIVFLAILPHGILEIPAFLISAAIGLKLGREILKTRGKRELKKELRRGLRFFLLLVVPLLLIAALIESFLIATMGI
jgi:stage II sporulation protein M